MRVRGFTLIELMVVVAIIGVLSAIAIPNFRRFACHTKQAEAKSLLSAIHTAQESYRAAHDMYMTDLTKLHFKAGVRRYAYTVTATVSTFTATADGSGAMTGDTWEIDQNRIIRNTANVCR